jgi:ABC-type transport system involved in multi-copper enzyme maturation permease subunit
MKKGKPFLEIFASAVHEDYRFPILELFAFLYAIGAFGFAATNLISGTNITTDEKWIFMLISTLMGTPLLVFLISILKNIAYGLGGDLEKGTIQTLLSYPLKRWSILTAKLLSALGVSALLFFGIQLTALVVMAPGIILPNIGTVLLTYIANFGYVLLLSAIILLITLFVKKGGVGLLMSIVAYFAIGIVNAIMLFVAAATSSNLPLQIIALLNPATALTAHYGFTPSNITWAPTLTEAALYVFVNYAIVAVLFSFVYFYFSRRLSI